MYELNRDAVTQNSWRECKNDPRAVINLSGYLIAKATYGHT